MAYNLIQPEAAGDLMKKECEFLSCYDLPAEPPCDYTLERLTGDASSRSYFRIVLPGRQTVVLMKMPEPFVEDEFAYLKNYNLFRSLGVRLAEIYSIKPPKGYVFLQDLGDLTFYELYSGWTEAERLGYYLRAIEYLHCIKDASPVEGLAFDHDKFLWELNYFKDHFLCGLLKAKLTAAEEERLQQQFSKLAGELAGEVRVFCHRDYHSRNLMLCGGEVYVIDFQDARLGPITYDLASLCYDSYIQHSPGFISELEDAYFRRHTNGRIRSYEYPRMCLQRNLKALGTFGYQYTKLDREFYLQFVPDTIGYVNKHFAELPEYRELKELLLPHITELT